MVGPISRLLTMLALFGIIQACNFSSGGGGGGGLISDNKPVENKFTASVVDGMYINGDNIDIQLAFPFVVTVTGTPSIDLDIGGVTKTANYVSGDGTKNLIFRYTVVLGDSDTDGISVTSPISLNGGGLTFYNQGTTTNCTLAFDPPNSSNVDVDAVTSTITNFSPPSDNLYTYGENLDFTLTWDESVTVTGTPRLVLNVGGSTLYADYLSGTGTPNLKFRYTVGSADLDLDGIGVASPVDLNSGTIEDSGGNAADLTFLPPGLPNVQVNGDMPIVINVTPPINGTYLLGENLTFSVQFSEVVNVTGTPRLVIDISGVTTYVNYLSGTGTDTLVFDYVVQPNEEDLDGIDLAPVIDLNGGSIADASLNPADPTFTYVPTAGIIVDGSIPDVTSISIADGIYTVGQFLNFTVTFDKDVIVTGAPTLQFLIGATTVEATYVSGSGGANLIYRYVVQNGENDLNGIDTVSPLLLNGGIIQSTTGANANLIFTPANFPNVLIDTDPASIVSITPPADAWYLETDNLDFTVNWSENVDVVGTPQIAIDIGGVTKYAQYVSGSGSTAHLYRYTVEAGVDDADGITISSPLDLNGGTLQDAATNAAVLTFTPPTMTNVTVDTTAPTISSVTGPADGSYKAGQTLDFTVNFSESVTVSATGTANIDIIVGATAYTAVCTSGTGTSTTCSYTVQADDTDSDGIASSSPLSLLAGNTITDAAGNDLVLTFIPPTTTAVLVDTTAPTITSVTPPENQTFASGESLSFVVNLDESVDVTGTPQLQLDIGGSTVYADYASGTGSAALTFTYVVQAGDLDTDGIKTVSPLGLNGGTIQDTATNDAVLTFTLPNTAGVNVDAVGPVITGHTVPSPGTYLLNDNIDIIVHYDKPVAVSGSPSIDLDVGGVTRSATYFSGRGSANITFRYTVQASEEDLDGVAYVTTIALNAGSMQDATANAAELLIGAISTPTVYVDSLAPTVALTTPDNNTYINIANDNAALAVTGTCDDATATYDLRVGGVSQSTLSCDGANLTGTVNSTTLAESTQNWDIVATDPASNSTTSTANSITRDVTRPTITSVTSADSGVTLTDETVTMTTNFSESVTVSAGPRLAMTVDTFTIAPYAACTATRGTSTSCVYTVVVGDYDNNGIALTSPLDLNAGTITDAAGNAIKTLTFTPPDISAVTVNNVYPEFEFYEDAALTIPITTLDFGQASKPATVTLDVYVKNVGTADTSASFTMATRGGRTCNAFRVGAIDDCTGNTPNGPTTIGSSCRVQFVFTAENPLGIKTCTGEATDAGYTNNPGFTFNMQGESI